MAQLVGLVGQKTIVLDFSHVHSARVGFAGEACSIFMVPTQITPQVVVPPLEEVRLTLTTLLSSIFYQYLHVKSRQVHVIVVEPMLWPRAWRDSLYSALFMDFQVKLNSLFFLQLTFKSTSTKSRLCIGVIREFPAESLYGTDSKRSFIRCHCLSLAVWRV